MARFMIDHAMKAAAWERAKGELRGLVHIQGSYSHGSPAGDCWRELESTVDKFIAEIEDNGLQK